MFPYSTSCWRCWKWHFFFSIMEDTTKSPEKGLCLSKLCLEEQTGGLGESTSQAQASEILGAGTGIGDTGIDLVTSTMPAPPERAGHQLQSYTASLQRGKIPWILQRFPGNTPLVNKGIPQEICVHTGM